MSAFSLWFFAPLTENLMRPPALGADEISVVNSSFSRRSNQFSTYSELRTLSNLAWPSLKNQRPVSYFLPSLPNRKKTRLSTSPERCEAPLSQPRAKIVSSALPNTVLYLDRPTFFLLFSDSASRTLFVVDFPLSRKRFSPKKCRARVKKSPI